jgi:hypothetical protein
MVMLRPDGKGPVVAIRVPLEATVKPQWRFDPAARVFKTRRGRTSFSPWDDLPVGTEIVYAVPRLADISPSELSKHERRLARSIQVILPLGKKPDDYLDVVRAWPSVDEVQMGPCPALPGIPPAPGLAT